MLPLSMITASKLKLKAVAYDGDDEYAAVAGNFAEHDKERTDSFSYGCWFRSTTTNFGVFLGKTLGTGGVSNLRGYNMYFFATDGTIGSNLNNNFIVAGNYISKATLASFNDGRWHFGVTTYDGSSTAAGLLIYIDAVVQPTVTLRDALTATIRNTAPLTFAAQSSIVTTNTQADMSHHFMVSRVLTADEITQMYARRSPPPYTSARFPFLAGVLQGFWLPELTDTNPTLTDTGSGGHDATMVNMEAADIFSR